MLQVKKNDLFVELISFNIIDNPERHKRIYIRDLKSESSARSKKMVRDYALSNDWNYFITITFDRKLYDRTDYKFIHNKLTKFLNNYKSRNDVDFQYILIHELHKKIDIRHGDTKRAIHYHGLFKINNLDYWKLSFLKQRDLAKIYRSAVVTKKFGKRNEFTLIYNNAEFLSYYITKYITKNISKEMILPSRYTTSRGLRLPLKHILSGFEENNFYKLKLNSDYENKFCIKYKFSIDDWSIVEKVINGEYLLPDDVLKFNAIKLINKYKI